VQRVLLVCPQERDVTEVTSAGLAERYAVELAGPDLDAVEELDAEALLAELARLPAEGVVAAKDRSALLAAVLAERRGLPGPSPAAVAACQHKATARALQEQAVPEATPRWFALDGTPPFGPPWFVKPVVGRLSQGARKVEDAAELGAAPAPPDGYAAGWEALARLGGVHLSARGEIAEEILAGAPVTVEGYAHGGSVTILGVTDSVMYPGTLSFERFEYPTALPPGRAEEVAGLAARLPPAFGFDGGFFNAEFAVPEDGRPAMLIELNARIASQFAPLYRAVQGRSSYDALFALACGRDPAWAPGPPDGVAVSYVLRRFEDAWVEAVPEPEDGVEILAHAGSNLSDAYANDIGSFRLAIAYDAGETREEAVARARRRAEALRFRLRPARPA
jgi:biotin carboxylase